MPRPFREPCSVSCDVCSPLMNVFMDHKCPPLAGGPFSAPCLDQRHSAEGPLGSDLCGAILLAPFKGADIKSHVPALSERVSACSDGSNLNNGQCSNVHHPSTCR